MKLYRIQNKDTGLFSNGGSNPIWNNRGKFWKSLSDVNKHLKVVKTRDNTGEIQNNYNNSIVIEYKLEKTEEFRVTGFGGWLK